MGVEKHSRTNVRREKVCRDGLRCQSGVWVLDVCLHASITIMWGWGGGPLRDILSLGTLAGGGRASWDCSAAVVVAAPRGPMGPGARWGPLGPLGPLGPPGAPMGPPWAPLGPPGPPWGPSGFQCNQMQPNATNATKCNQMQPNATNATKCNQCNQMQPMRPGAQPPPDTMQWTQDPGPMGPLAQGAHWAVGPRGTREGGMAPPWGPRDLWGPT